MQRIQREQARKYAFDFRDEQIKGEQIKGVSTL